MRQGGIGYENLVHVARKAAIGPDGFTSRTAHRAIARSVGKAALGIACPPEMVRVQNGDWEVIDLGGHDAAETVTDFPDGLDLQGCDVVLFETLTEGTLKDRIAASIERSSPVPVKVLPAPAVAHGALARGVSGRGRGADLLRLPAQAVHDRLWTRRRDELRPHTTGRDAGSRPHVSQP